MSACGSYTPGDRPPAPRRTFRRLWEMRFAAEWRRAFLMFSASACALCMLQVPCILGLHISPIWHVEHARDTILYYLHLCA